MEIDMTTPSTSRATIPGNSVQMDIASEATGRKYRILVLKPEAPAGPEGYPVVFLMDGNITFPIAAVQMFGAAGFAYRPAIIVGVGYQADDYATLLGERAGRFLDFTPATDPLQLPEGLRGGKTSASFGGADAFLDFILDDVVGLLASKYPVDCTRLSIFGHSLGGFLVLQALYSRPTTFANFIAASPSIWFPNTRLAELEPSLRSRIEGRLASPRVLIEVGGDEQTPIESRFGAPQEVVANYNNFLELGRMLDNARELAARLAAIKGGPDYLVRFNVLEGEDHATVHARAITNALKFALST